MVSDDTLSAVFQALADPTRRGILERLGSGDATVSELAAPFDISLPAISRHLKVLETAGLITRSRRAQWRTSTLRAAPLDDVGEWVEHMRTLWDDRFDRLDIHLRELKRLSELGSSHQPEGRPPAPGHQPETGQHDDKATPEDKDENND